MSATASRARPAPMLSVRVLEPHHPGGRIAVTAAAPPTTQRRARLDCPAGRRGPTRLTQEGLDDERRDFEALRRDRRRWLRRGGVRQGAGEARHPGDGPRPEQLPPVPAAPLPGRDRGAGHAGRGPATPGHLQEEPHRPVPPRRGDRGRPATPDGHHRRRPDVHRRLPGAGGGLATELLPDPGGRGTCLPALHGRARGSAPHASAGDPRGRRRRPPSRGRGRVELRRRRRRPDRRRDRRGHGRRRQPGHPQAAPRCRGQPGPDLPGGPRVGGAGGVLRQGAHLRRRQAAAQRGAPEAGDRGHGDRSRAR